MRNENRDEIVTPCYVINQNWHGSIEYRDDWCYGRSESIGPCVNGDADRNRIKADIRRHWSERNGIPVYTVSDHGNVCRSRAIRLRREPGIRTAGGR